MEAVRWYRLGAEQGSVGAQFNLGTMYAGGQGVAVDAVLAYKWWDLATAQGDETARRNIDIIEGMMTPEQIAEAQRLSREWIETHPPPVTLSVTNPTVYGGCWRLKRKQKPSK